MHATHLFSAAKAELDLRGELVRHTWVNESWCRNIRIRSSGTAVSRRLCSAAREPKPRCTHHRQGLLAWCDKQFEAPVCVHFLENRLWTMHDTLKASRGQQWALAERSEGWLCGSRRS
jgi:hypothetical protein